MRFDIRFHCASSDLNYNGLKLVVLDATSINSNIARNMIFFLFEILDRDYQD